LAGSVRVAHVVPTDRIAWLLLRAGLARLQEAGYDVTVVCGDAGYGQRLEAAGMAVVHVPFAREVAPVTDARCVAALRRELRRGAFSIAHSHNPKGTLLGPLAARLAGVPVVVHTVHGFLFNDATRGVRRGLAIAAERWCAGWCHQLLFQSVEDHQWAVQRHYKAAARLHWVGNGIDERRFDPTRYPDARRRTRAALGLGDDDLVVGCVGRFVREKGFVELAQMARRVAARQPRFRLLVVGIAEPEQSDSVDPHGLLAAAGVADRSIVLERRDDMPELYASMDVAVLPSHREGIPRALLEAGAMGVPLVATAIRGCREVIADGATGLLFGVRDIDAFAAAVEALLNDAARRRQLGAAARTRVLSAYTEAATAARIIACYERFLVGQGLPAPSSPTRR
jgi:glycosyltransferase involved in cell wall biosynthesis